MEDIFRLLDREVWVVTAADRDRRGGLLATWVGRVSLDPARPTVLAGLGPRHFTTELVDQSGQFGLHLLRKDQTDLGLQFALGSGRDRDKFAGVPWQASTSGIPLLTDCRARLECRVHARLDTGDRIFFWAHVLHGQQVTQGPLLHEEHLLAAAGPAERQLLKADRQRDAELPWQPGKWKTWDG